MFRLRFRGERPHPISCFRRWPNPTWRRLIGRQDSSGAVGPSAAPVENGDDRTVLEKIVLRAGWPAPAISEGASDCRGLTVQLGKEVMGEVGDFEAAAVQLTVQRLDVEAPRPRPTASGPNPPRPPHPRTGPPSCGPPPPASPRDAAPSPTARPAGPHELRSHQPPETPFRTSTSIDMDRSEDTNATTTRHDTPGGPITGKRVVP